MHYLFCHYSDDAEGSIVTEDRFVKRRPPKSLESSLERSFDEVERLEKSIKLPVALTVIKWITLFLGFIICPQLLTSDVTFEQGYSNAPALYWIGPISLVIGGSLYLFDKRRKKRLLDSADYQDAVRRCEKAEQNLDWESGAPVDTAESRIVILSLCCSSKNGSVDYFRPAIAYGMTVFIEDNELCLFDGICVYSFPKDVILGISRVDKTLSVIDLEKGLDHYYTLDISCGGEQYCMSFPEYELDKIENLTGLKAPVFQGATEAKPEKIRPVFYWDVPKNSIMFIAPDADAHFKSLHPVLYVVSSILAFFAFFAPSAVFFVLAKRSDGNVDSLWTILGLVGGLFIGAVLLNYYAAWLHQYLGHKVTLICLAIGVAMMTFSWLMIA